MSATCFPISDHTTHSLKCHYSIHILHTFTQEIFFKTYYYQIIFYLENVRLERLCSMLLNWSSSSGLPFINKLGNKITKHR